MWKLVYVEWLDAVGDHGWMSPNVQREFDFDPMKVCTVGWIVRETKEYLTVVQSYSAENHVNSYITIPKGWIKKRKTLRV